MAFGLLGPLGQPVVWIASITDAACVTVRLLRMAANTVTGMTLTLLTAPEEHVKVEV